MIGVEMKHNHVLIIMSLLSILFMTLHMTSDILRARPGTAEAGGSTLVAVPILVLWLYGTLLLAERRSGHIIMLIGSLIAIGMPVLHVNFAAGIFHGQLAKGNGDFIFVWVLYLLAVTGMFSLILSISGMWGLRRSNSGSGTIRTAAEA